MIIPLLVAFLALGQQAQPKYCAGGAPPKNDPDCITVSQGLAKWAAQLPIASTDGGIDYGYEKPLSNSLTCASGQHIQTYETCDISKFCGPGSIGREQHERCVDDTTTLIGTTTIAVLGPKITPANCDKQYEYAVVGMGDHGEYKEQCFSLIHSVTEREWQHLHDAITVDEELIRSLIEQNKAQQLALESQWERLKALEAKGK